MTCQVVSPYTLPVPALTPEMGRVVTRKRRAVLGSLRKAATAARSVGTWQRIEHGQEFELTSLDDIVAALGWPAAAADQLLRGVDPDGVQDMTPVIRPMSEDFKRRFREIYVEWVADMGRTLDAMLMHLVGSALWLHEVERYLAEGNEPTEHTELEAMVEFLRSPWGQDMEYAHVDARRAVREGVLPVIPEPRPLRQALDRLREDRQALDDLAWSEANPDRPLAADTGSQDPGVGPETAEEPPDNQPGEFPGA